MKFIVLYIQFINSFEGLGLFFSSTAFIRRLRRYAATSVIKDNPQIKRKIEETNPKNFSIGRLTYNLDFERIKTNGMRNFFKTHACRNKNSQEIYNTHQEVEKLIGRFDVFYNRKNGRLYCTNLYSEVKLRLQLIERLKYPPMTTLKQFSTSHLKVQPYITPTFTHYQKKRLKNLPSCKLSFSPHFYFHYFS